MAICTCRSHNEPYVWGLANSKERILDGLSLGAKERDLEPIGHENMKIERQNTSPHLLLLLLGF
ncbi:hypothetical protein MTR_2g046040 [Medicago truncatula]|uniref:Uncharacterized protein n=1 Tax=Medicago truncatula TaxID=3880 RepID=A0A072V8M4_MEDTR|nr:hypothetical protein MTR_2g046040 [Medicago truncatula]